ncbi:hypothetical protein ACSQ67_008735 [Phaseolus vulgaris]
MAFAEATMAFVEAEAAAASRFTTMMFYGAEKDEALPHWLLAFATHVSSFHDPFLYIYLMQILNKPNVSSDRRVRRTTELNQEVECLRAEVDCLGLELGNKT